MKKITISVGWLALGICLILMGMLGTGYTIWLERCLAQYEKGRAAQSSPTSTNMVARVDGQRYKEVTVKEGDDYVSIAIACGVAPSKILECNGLTISDTLKPGMKLLVPCMETSNENKQRADRAVREVEKPRKLILEKVHYLADEETISLHFNALPDIDVMRNYITVSPLRSGVVSVDLRKECGYKPRRGATVLVKGDFAYQTNVVFRLRQGLPAAKHENLEALATDGILSFQRKDAPPRVQFSSHGRYLPPGGNRLLAIDSINVSKVRMGAAAIPSENIVQLLAREEGVYKHIWQEMKADSKFTEDLANKLGEWDVETKGTLNEHCITPCALQTLPDASSNGVFLVVVRSADREREDYRSWWKDARGEQWNPNRYRLVCVTDLGLTVRRNGAQLLVWTTSLTTGVPVTNGVVDVYASNNRKIGTGLMDGQGLCTIECEKDQTPFAVIARKNDGSDTSFLCLKNHLSLEERHLPNGVCEPYLKSEEMTAFVWTERRIYRHAEPIFLHALLRRGDFTAPRPLPVEARLVDPAGRTVGRKSLMTDSEGAVWFDGFTAAAEQPSGMWRVEIRTPGENGKLLGRQNVSVEEFVPPQIKVAVKTKVVSSTNVVLNVSAEHMFGGPAQHLSCRGTVLFEDVAFRPIGWTDWSFGDETKRLKPSCRRLEGRRLDEKGCAEFEASLHAGSGVPKAAIRVTGQGVVTTAGGRPACGQTTAVFHYYPFYVGARLANNIQILTEGCPTVRVACVKPDGTRLPEGRCLKVEFERVESVYNCKETEDGWVNWSCDRIFVPCKIATTKIETRSDADINLEIPFRQVGDYRLRLTDERTGVSFAKTFWLGNRGDDQIRAPLANPSEVTLSTDKEIYRPGERPRLLVKAPFAGWALLTTMREKILSTKVFRLSGATAELILDPVEGQWTPNVDIALSVVQTAENDGYGQTSRAHGRTSVKIRRLENELPVRVATSYEAAGLNKGLLKVDISACGSVATGTTAFVTVVDEGIHSLTKWATPAPIEYFARLRTGNHPLFDLFDNLLPVWDGDPAKVRGVKTGGGGELEMLGRMSPIRSRRFKPLALWQVELPLTNGLGKTVFTLPEFSGEVRVTAVAYSDRAVGAGDAQLKIVPRLVMEPDLPRFVAPNDKFSATLSLYNQSSSKGDVAWTVEQMFDGREKVLVGTTLTSLAAGTSTNLSFDVMAPAKSGELKLVFTAAGLGERHTRTIELPVRPAISARETSCTISLSPGETKTFSVETNGVSPESTVRTFTMHGNKLGELVGALEFLANYPHGCLEQTTSQIFPLVAAGGFLNQLQVTTGALSNRTAYVEAGLRRVQRMIRSNDFTMWPDTSYAPWDREVSLYAIHFLLAAEKNGYKLNPTARERIIHFLHRWVGDKNLQIQAYVCLNFALGGIPMKDQMLVLYDQRKRLNVLARARLSRAFALTGDRARATELMREGVTQPTSIVEGAFTILALLELDPQDMRLGALVAYLEKQRKPARFDWGTTRENAHALLALGTYYRHFAPVQGKPQLVLVRADGTESLLPEKRRKIVRGAETVQVENRGTGTAWLVWREIGMPNMSSITNESHTLAITRTIRDSKGNPADLNALHRGEMLIVDLELSSMTEQTFSDLVIVDLFSGAFEPDHGGMWPSEIGKPFPKQIDWVMRSDARDDRMLVFSKRFTLKRGESVHFSYLLNVVTPGMFTLPGPTVEAMYAPDIYSVCAPTRLRVLP